MVFCFSGTGNSRYIARRIADELQEEIIDLNEKIKATDYSPIKTDDNVIVVTPTYAWCIPRIVSDWLSKTDLLSAKRIWFVMNCGGEIGNAAKYNRRLAKQKNLQYMGTAQILMPENYIAMFGAPKVEEAKLPLFKSIPHRARGRYHIAPCVQEGIRRFRHEEAAHGQEPERRICTASC